MLKECWERFQKVIPLSQRHDQLYISYYWHRHETSLIMFLQMLTKRSSADSSDNLLQYLVSFTVRECLSVLEVLACNLSPLFFCSVLNRHYYFPFCNRLLHIWRLLSCLPTVFLLFKNKQMPFFPHRSCSPDLWSVCNPPLPSLHLICFSLGKQLRNCLQPMKEKNYFLCLKYETSICTYQ